MANSHNGYHRAVTLGVHNAEVEVDLEIADLVLWLNGLRGVETYTSCQGGPCSQDAFVGFKCQDESVLSEIKAFIGTFGTINVIGPNDYHLRLPDTDTLIKFNMLRFPNSIFSIH